MPVINRRQCSPDLRQRADSDLSRSGSETTEPAHRDHVWLHDDLFERPQKQMHFAATGLPMLAGVRKSQSSLQLTRVESHLHDRYESSEEEASPSPDDFVDPDDNLEHITLVPESAAQPENEPAELELPLTVIDASALAVAVPMLHVGCPILINITNLAPMHKRKRSIPNLRSRSKSPANRLLPVPEAVQFIPYSKKRSFPIRNESFPILQPSRWLDETDDGVSFGGEEENFLTEDDIVEHMLGHAATVDENDYSSTLVNHIPTSYAAYDPYALDPPKLPYARGQASEPTSPTSPTRLRSVRSAAGAGWRGLGKSFGLVKKRTKGTQLMRMRDERDTRYAHRFGCDFTSGDCWCDLNHSDQDALRRWGSSLP